MQKRRERLDEVYVHVLLSLTFLDKLVIIMTKNEEFCISHGLRMKTFFNPLKEVSKDIILFFERNEPLRL